MTFKETEFPSLLKFLKTFVNEETDPILIKEVLIQFIKLYEDVPLYPGIVGMCMGKVVKTVGADDLTVGQKIYVKNKDDSFYGTVVKKDSDGIILKNARCVSAEDELELGYRELERITVVNEKVLEELWPSLVFEKEKKR